MVKKLPTFAVNGWLIDAHAYWFSATGVDANVARVHLTCERGKELFQFCIDLQAYDTEDRRIIMALAVVIATWMVPLLELNIGKWYSETDLPLSVFRILKLRSGYYVKYAGPTCNCSPCKVVHTLLVRNRCEIEEFCYGTENQAESPSDQDRAIGHSD